MASQRWRRPAAPGGGQGSAATADPTVRRPRRRTPGRPAAGLTSAEAARRLRTDGPNAVGREGHRGPLAILISQFASPLVLILLAASLVSVAVGDKVEAGIILTIVLLSAALGFVQEARSAAAVEALQARLALKATVVRDGKQVDLPIVQLVCGDLILLGAGDIVPADARILESNHLYIDESSLTGESAASAKVLEGRRPGPHQGRRSRRPGLLRDERRQRQRQGRRDRDRRTHELRRHRPPAAGARAPHRFPGGRPSLRVPDHAR